MNLRYVLCRRCCAAVTEFAERERYYTPMFRLIKELINCPSVSGRESAISLKLESMIKKYADEVYSDSLGSLIAVKHGVGAQGTKKKIMLCAHMDEIGFMATYIEDSGYIRCAAIGGIDFAAAAYSNVVFENGTYGVLVPESKCKPADYKAESFYVDIGAKDKREAEKKVKIGDFFAVEPSLRRLCGKKICGRPLDDRVGCAVLLETARKISESQKKPENDIYFVFSVQEEVGCRGARPAAFGISPDFALVFDVTGTGDCIGSKPMAVSVGGGAAVKIKDSSVICNTETVDRLINLAQANGIRYQCEILTYGGTDTSAIQMTGSGCRVGALSIPSRYIHTGAELIDMRDAEECVKLALAFIANM